MTASQTLQGIFVSMNNETAVQQKLAAMFTVNKDDVSIPKIYIDMTDDIGAAAVLDELMFWTLPKKGTGKTSLRVFRNGALWLAVRRKDWWDRKRLTERQADAAIAKLVKQEIVEKDVFLFDGKPTVHLRLKMDSFISLYSKNIQEMAEKENDENLIRDIADLYQMMGFPNEMVNSNLPNGEMLNLPNGEIINSPVQPPITSSEKPQKTGELPEGFGIDWAVATGKKVTEKQLFKLSETKAFDDMLDGQFRRLRLNFSAFDEKAKEAFRRFIRLQPKDQTLERFVSWWLEDEWRAANPPYTLGVIMQRWLQAFTKHTDETKGSYTVPPTLERDL